MFGPGGSDIGALRGDPHPRAEAQLGEDVRDVALDRPQRDLQPPGRHSRRSTQRSGRDPTGRAGPGSAGPHQQEDEERVAAARSRTAEGSAERHAPSRSRTSSPTSTGSMGGRTWQGAETAGGVERRAYARRRGRPIDAVSSRGRRRRTAGPAQPGTRGPPVRRRSQPGGCRPAGRQQLCGDREAVPQAAVVPTRAGHHVVGDEGISGQPVQQDTPGTVGTQVRYRPGSTDRGLDVSGSAGGPPATRTRAARSAAARAAGSASWRRPPRRSGPSRAVR
jgi:hypothetical protein